MAEKPGLNQVIPLVQLFPPAWEPSEGMRMQWPGEDPVEYRSGAWLLLRHEQKFDGGDSWELEADDDKPLPWVI